MAAKVKQSAGDLDGPAGPRSSCNIPKRGAGPVGHSGRKEGDVAKTHFVILLFPPLTDRPTDRRRAERKEGEGNEADTDADAKEGEKAKLAHFRVAGWLSVSVICFEKVTHSLNWWASCHLVCGLSFTLHVSSKCARIYFVWGGEKRRLGLW